MAEPLTTFGLRVRAARRLAAVLLALSLTVLLSPRDSRPQTAAPPTLRPGQTATLLGDGRWLLIGGQQRGQVTATSTIVDPETGSITSLPNLATARSGHSATTLPDGTVLVLGGTGRDGRVVVTAERFIAGTQQFEIVSVAGLIPRASHTATLLTDGRILVAGGEGDSGRVVATAQLWDPQGGAVQTVGMGSARTGHTAALQSDGTVLLWGGTTAGGSPVSAGDVFDPVQTRFATVTTPPQPSSDPPQLEASLPAANAADVPTDGMIALRMSTPLRVDTVNSGSVTLSDPAGPVPASVVVAEGGLLIFVRPAAALSPGTHYTLSVNGAEDRQGALFPFTTVPFTTMQPGVSASVSARAQQGITQAAPGSSASEKDSDGDGEVWRGERRDGKPHSRWRELPPLQAPLGVTALAGQVLKLNGEPVAHVTLAIEGRRAGRRIRIRTDATGRFLLSRVAPGHHELLIDGRSATQPGRTYGVFEVGVDLLKGETSVLPYTIWMPALDMAHAVTIPVPTAREVIVTTPRLPGLELRIPAGTTITDHEGKVVRQVSITPIPLDRPPFPLPKGVDVPIYFTVQPGGAYLANASYAGARLIYPNSNGAQPGTTFDFWNYDAEEKGWYVYGQGRVAADGQQIVPNPRVSVYEFSGAMVANPSLAPPSGPDPESGSTDGDPVDLGTGLFVYTKTDLMLPDVLPIALTRTYRPNDTTSRAFGIGTTHAYDMFLAGDILPWTYTDLILPDGGRVHYQRTSPGTEWYNAIYEHTGAPAVFHKTEIRWGGYSFYLKMKDGTVYTFQEASAAVRPMQGGLLNIYDRHGNYIVLTRNADGDLTRITSPSGRWIDLTYDAAHRVIQARDSAGRAADYSYDASGRLASVIDAASGTTSYTYDSQHRMLTVTDAKGIVYLTNEYDGQGRVTKQTQADSTTYQFAYTVDISGAIVQTDVTDPRGNNRRVTFSGGLPVSETRALGTAIAQTTTWERQAGTNFVTAVVDPLNRRTEYTYASNGNVLTVTRLAGTANAATTTFTYDIGFWPLLASITDPLNHTTTFAYSHPGNVATVTDPLSHATTFTYNAAGQPLTITTPLSHTTQLTYQSGLLATVTDPLGKTASRAYDGAGRLATATTPLGRFTAFQYDALNAVKKITDSLGGTTRFTYDPNGNLLSLTDARNNATSYVYDTMDRVTTRTDPLTHAETYAHDNNGNPTSFTDRKSQVTATTYDALDRPTLVTYQDSSTTAYTWDAGNRLTQLVDSISGTITRTYDGLDRLTQEVTPQGAISHTYDAAGRRTSMTVLGQPTVSYTYDNADRLTQITQGAAIVAMTYDNANRRTSLTLPNGVVTEYAYDTASRLAGLTYKLGGTPLGALTYTYDAAGNRTVVGGTWARTGLPAALTGATYNAANQQTVFGGTAQTFDLNGNLTTDGTLTYTWDAHNRLAGLSGGATASFQYDALGRRASKAIDSTQTSFLYDGLTPVQELSGSTPTANLLTGPDIDEYLTRTDATATRTYLADALSSTVALTDDSGAVQASYTYEPFGATSSTGMPGSNAFDYTGRESDGTGLKHYRSRYYHPQLQRFTAEDAVRFSGGFNLYAYVDNSPVQHADPLGYAKGGEQKINVTHDGKVLTKKTPIQEVQAALDEAIERGMSRAHVKKLKGLLKVISRGGVAGIIGFILGELLDPREAGAGSECPQGPRTCILSGGLLPVGSGLPLSLSGRKDAYWADTWPSVK